MNFLTRRIINPHFDDERAVRNLAITVQVVTLLVVIGISFMLTTKIVLWVLAGLLVLTTLLALGGVVWPGQILTPVAITIVASNFMLQGNGIHDIAILGLIGSVVVAGLFLGEWGAVIFSTISVLILAAMGLAEAAGTFTPVPPKYPAYDDIFIGAAIVVGIGLSLYTTVARLRVIVANARDNESAQVTANRELLQLKRNLEDRVEERTRDLERRASLMEAVSKVARSISTIQDLDNLLPAITEVVSEQFGYYHTGIFLVDQNNEYAILQAANSEGGKNMLKRGHRLRLGTTGIVGYSAAQGESRIALDVGADAVYFNNPDLPNTRSEIALPLKVGGQTIGVLDVQSVETNAFKNEDIIVLNTLANQIAIAIENARLFSQINQALTESRTIYDEYVKQEWVRFAQQVKNLGYTYDGIRSTPIATATDTSDPMVKKVPIRVRGLVIGHVSIRSNDPLREWSRDEISLVQAAAERAGLAIENARLLNEAQRRAAKERMVGEIASRIGASIDINSIMQTAVEELGKTLPGSEIILQFNQQQMDENK